jgi:hypothetical protein
VVEASLLGKGLGISRLCRVIQFPSYFIGLALTVVGMQHRQQYLRSLHLQFEDNKGEQPKLRLLLHLTGRHDTDPFLVQSPDASASLNLTGSCSLGRPWNNLSRVVYLNTYMVLSEAALRSFQRYTIAHC